MKTFFKFTLIAFALTLFLVNCEQNYTESLTTEEVRTQKNYESDLKTTHDEYCDWLCDSITTWRNNSQLDESKIPVLWDAIVNHLSQTLQLPSQDILSIFNDLDITDNNYTSVYEDKYPQLNVNQQAFIDDLEDSFIANFDSSDEDLLDLLETKRVYWKGILDQNEVDNSIDIARSSMIYWKHNFGCISILRGDPKTGAAKLAVGDVTGALWGSFGGPAGALLGAVGGTLGASIQMAIFGW